MIPRMKLLPILAVLAVSLALVAALPVALSAPEALPPAAPASDAVPDQKVVPQVVASEVPQATPESTAEQELTPDGWQILAPGIDYREFRLPDPNNVFVARMDRANQDLTLESSLGQGKLAEGFETISSQARRYDQTINYWGRKWGDRNRVVVAINGDYPEVEVQDDGTRIIYPQPQHGQIYSGWYVKRYPNANEVTSGSGFVWDLDRSAYVGECVTHPPDKQLITFPSSNTKEFDGVNVPREKDQLIVYTPQYNSNTGTDDTGIEILVEMERPTSILYGQEKAFGYVRAINDNQGSTLIPFDHIVLSAHGTARKVLRNQGLQIGDKIAVSQRVKNCDTSLPFDWLDSYASVGGDFYFLKDGVIKSFPTDAGATARHPRTAIAYNDKYVYFVVVDGRDPWNSIGMTINELAKFAKNTLEATYGIAEDGGGSSTMVVNGVVKNNTFCNNVFCKGQIFLPLIVSSGSNNTGSNQSSNGANPSPSALSTPVPDPENGTYGNDGVLELDPNTGVMQRALVNGMLMVVVEPITQTETFTTSQTVTVYSPGNLRLGPGTNYASLGTLDAGTEGEILDDSHGLNGVLATGYNWWKVDFGSGLVGWMNEQSLTPPSAASYLPYSFWDLRRPR
jgi:hypothetical protein